MYVVNARSAQRRDGKHSMTPYDPPSPPIHPLPPSAPGAFAGGFIFVGVIISLFGAVLVALSMVLQRFALTYPTERVPLCGIKLKRNAVWVIGLVIYGAGNGANAVAQQMAPLSLLSATFTTCLLYTSPSPRDS